MVNPGVPNLGTIITNPKARAAIYATYGILAFIAAAVTVGFAASTGGVPSWLAITNAVGVFVGAGVGGLANANTPTSTPQGDL